MEAPPTKRRKCMSHDEKNHKSRNRYFQAFFGSIAKDLDDATDLEIDPSYYLTQLQPVLHRDEIRDAEFTSFFVSTVSDPKCITELIAYINSHFPLESMSHLKRIRKCQKSDNKIEILIGPADAVQQAPVEVSTRLKEHFKLELRLYDIPKQLPLMRSQYENWSAFWPMTYKAHIPSTPPPQDTFSDNLFMQKMIAEMRKLIPLAKEHGNACAILTRSGAVLAQAVASPMSPISHCAIQAINEVAAKQLEASGNGTFQHQKRNAEHTSMSEPSSHEYLCTGCTALFVREPCIMCSMALLHSRVACVVYATPNEKSGGLGSRFSIHCEYRLNHHFYVYKGFLAMEAASQS